MNGNNGYPSRSLKPTGGTRTFGSDPQGGDYYGQGNQGMQMRDPAQVIQGLIRGNAQGRGSWDWNNADKKSHFNEEMVSNLLGYEESQLDAELKAQALAIAGKLMAMFIRDVEQGNTAGRYAWFQQGASIFQYIPNVPNQVCPTRSAFADYVKGKPGLKISIARHAAVVGGYNVAVRLAGGNQDVKPQEAADYFTVGVVNIFFMEMINWFSKTQEGQRAYAARSRQLDESLRRLDVYKRDIGECFIYMGLENPYADLSPEPTAHFDPEAHPSRFASRAAATLQNTFHDFPVNTGGVRQGEIDDIYAMVYHNAELANAPGNVQRQQQAMQSFNNDQHFSYGTPTSGRKDYSNITEENRSEFDLNVFHRVGNTEWHVVDEEIWKKIHGAFKRSSKQRIMCGLFPHTHRVVKIDIDRDDGWETKVVRLEGVDPMFVLSNPDVLLPVLEEQNGEIKITNYDLNEVMDDGSKENFVPLPVKSLEEKPVVVNNDLVMESARSEDIESALDTLYEEVRPSEIKSMFGVSTAGRNWKPFRLVSNEEVGMVYRLLPYLVKNAGHDPRNFFDMVRTTRRTLNERFGNDELTELVENHIEQALNRWFVEARGFGPTMNDPFHFRSKNLFRTIDDTEEFFKRNDPDTYDALCTTERFKRLADRCRLFASPEDRERLLGDNPVTRFNNARTIVVSKEFVLTKIGGQLPPMLENQTDTVTVKRSIFPEAFSLVEQSYGKASKNLSSGADQFFLFDSDDSLWVFITTDFDRNTGVLRKIIQRQELVDLQFQPYR